MNWRDFLSLAVQLAAGTGEADWRTAASRAYYAAFHVARQLLSDLGFVVPRADAAHRYLSLRLSNCGETTLEASGRNLETLRRLRNRADYDTRPPFPSNEAEAAVRLAENIIQVLDGALHEPTRTTITDAIRNYERHVLQVVTWRPWCVRKERLVRARSVSDG